MLADCYIPSFSNGMKIAVQKNNLGVKFGTEVWSLLHKTASIILSSILMKWATVTIFITTSGSIVFLLTLMSFASLVVVMRELFVGLTTTTSPQNSNYRNALSNNHINQLRSSEKMVAIKNQSTNEKSWFY